MDENKDDKERAGTVRRKVIEHLRALLLAGAAGGAAAACPPVVCDPLPPPIECDRLAASLEEYATLEARWTRTQSQELAMDLRMQLRDYEDQVTLSQPPVVTGGSLITHTIDADIVEATLLPDPNVTTVRVAFPLTCENAAQQIVLDLDALGPVDGQPIPYTVVTN